MSDDLKAGLMTNGSHEHVEEFGDCEGIVGDPCYPNVEGPEVDVRWEPSKLRYGYDPKQLVKI